MLDYLTLRTPEAAGGAGVATATVTSTVPVEGRLYGVYLEYGDTPPATTDVTLAWETPSHTIFTRADSGTNGMFFPRVQAHTAAGANLAGEQDDAVSPVVHGRLVLTMAQANNGDYVTAHVWFER